MDARSSAIKTVFGTLIQVATVLTLLQYGQVGRLVSRLLLLKAQSQEDRTVGKVIDPIIPSEPEKVEIEVHDADHLYKEIRIENKLVDFRGEGSQAEG